MGIFLLCFSFLEGIAQVTGAALDKINCTIPMNNSLEIFFGWTQPIYFLSVEVSEQSLFLDLDSLNLLYHLCYLEVFPQDYFFSVKKKRDQQRMKDKWSWKTPPENTGMVSPRNTVGINFIFNLSGSQISVQILLLSRYFSAHQ